MADTNQIPFIRRKSTLIGGGTLLTVLVVFLTLSASPSRPVAPSTKPGAAQGQGMGTAGQTAEFNQTFAARLREEQARDSARLLREMKEQSEARISAEAERLRSEVAKRDEVFVQKMDMLIKAQEDATAAADARKKRDGIKPLRFVSPGAAELEGVGDAAGVHSAGPNSSSDLQQTAANVSATRSVIPPNGFVSGRLLNGVVSTLG